MINLSLPMIVFVVGCLDFELVDDLRPLPYCCYNDFSLPEKPIIEMSNEPQEPISCDKYLLPSKDANTTRIDEYG